MRYSQSLSVMKKIFLAIAAIIVLLSCINKKVDDPLSLSIRIFSKVPFSEIGKYSTGEYKGHPNGNDISNSLKTSFTLLEQKDSTAVVNVTIADSLGHGADTYLYLKKDSIWKASAFRSLAMTGLIQQVLDELEKMTPAQVDSVVKSTNVHKEFQSKQDYLDMIGNAKLTLAFDTRLISHFNENKQAFEKLKDELLARGIMKTNSLKNMRDTGDLNTRVKRLLLSGVHTDGEGAGKYLNFLIGGVTDNSVGYLYIKNKKDVPQMSPSDFIMVREIGNGWYLYKTT